MPSGQELLEEATAICREIANDLGSRDGASRAWQDSVVEIVERFDEVSGTFFFKTMPSVPVARACQRAAADLRSELEKGDWAEFEPCLQRFIKSAQNLIEKAGMKGTTLT